MSIIIAERYKAGESLEELAEDCDCDRAKIEEAIRCELTIIARAKIPSKGLPKWQGYNVEKAKSFTQKNY